MQLFSEALQPTPPLPEVLMLLLRSTLAVADIIYFMIMALSHIAQAMKFPVQILLVSSIFLTRQIFRLIPTLQFRMN